jgi:hypothetical protein
VERRVFIIAQNPAVLPDRRVWLACKPSSRRVIGSPLGVPRTVADPAYQVIDKVEPLGRDDVKPDDVREHAMTIVALSWVPTSPSAASFPAAWTPASSLCSRTRPTLQSLGSFMASAVHK